MTIKKSPPKLDYFKLTKRVCEVLVCFSGGATCVISLKTLG